MPELRFGPTGSVSQMPYMWLRWHEALAMLPSLYEAVDRRTHAEWQDAGYANILEEWPALQKLSGCFRVVDGTTVIVEFQGG
jgi:hypothetical protein